MRRRALSVAFVIAAAAAVRAQSAGTMQSDHKMAPEPRMDATYALGHEGVNVVPDYAEVWYNTRDVTIEGSEEVYKRIRKIADAAAARAVKTCATISL